MNNKTIALFVDAGNRFVKPVFSNVARGCYQKIDSIFSKWNKDNSPGCTVVGIVRNDSLIFAKATAWPT